MTTVQNRPAARRAPLGGGQIAMIVIGALAALVGLGLLAGAVAVAAAGHDRSGGFLTTGQATVASRSYAVTVPDVGIDIRGPDQAYAREILGTVRIRATSADPGVPIFVGIARTADADRYLRGVGHSAIADLDVDPVAIEYVEQAGGAPASTPGKQTFWDRSDSGTGTRTLDWDVAAGDWTVVVMNADSSQGVRADVDLGGTLPVLRGVTIGLFVGGGVLLAGGLLLVVLPLATRRRPTRPARTYPGTGAPA